MFDLKDIKEDLAHFIKEDNLRFFKHIIEVELLLKPETNKEASFSEEVTNELLIYSFLLAKEIKSIEIIKYLSKFAITSNFSTSNKFN